MPFDGTIDLNCTAEFPRTICFRLEKLAPEHQRAAISKAMRTAGIAGCDKPSKEILKVAENPPAPLHTYIYKDSPRPDAKDIERRVGQLLASHDFRDSIEQNGQLCGPAWLRVRAQMRAEDELVRAWMCGRYLPVLANREEYEAGQRIAAKWRSTLEALADLLDHLDHHIPDLELATTSEDTLRAQARLAAEHGKYLYPEPEPGEQRRLCDPANHLRQLRRRAKAARQHASAILGTVGAGARPYADDFSLRAWSERQDAARAFAMANELIGDDGTKLDMWEIMQNSRKAAIARTYAMTIGIDQLAEKEKRTALFITITLPSEYHPNPSNYGQAYDARLSPADADSELARLWCSFRRKLNHNGVHPWGLWVKEPHRDGCPHLHALLYIEDGQEELTDEILQKIRPDVEEGPRVATKCVLIDRKRAKPTSYLMKYLIKSLNSADAALKYGATADKAGVLRQVDEDHLANHDRHRAWASERGLRRWGFIGTHGVQRIWQRLRTIKELPFGSPKRVEQAWKCLKDRRAYGEALELMGAIRGRGTRLRLAYSTGWTDMQNERHFHENSYGEQIKFPAWIEDEENGWRLPLKDTDWQVEKKEPTEYNFDLEKWMLDRVASRIAKQAGLKPLISIERSIDVSCPRQDLETNNDDPIEKFNPEIYSIHKFRGPPDPILLALTG